jgi:hypothetical protein
VHGALCNLFTSFFIRLLFERITLLVLLTLKWKLIKMTVQDYLLKFRKINSLESLEKLFDHLNYTLTDNQDIISMYRAADHRRAELVSGGRLFNIGEVPKSVWRFVQ